MKIQELRVGNWIHWDNIGHSEVTPLRMRQACALEGDVTNWSGIELMDEWLGRIAETDDGGATWFVSPSTMQWRMRITCDDGAYAWTSSTFGIQVNLMYVHQLQNLFYALTGEELTIKK